MLSSIYANTLQLYWNLPKKYHLPFLPIALFYTIYYAGTTVWVVVAIFQTCIIYVTELYGTDFNSLYYAFTSYQVPVPAFTVALQHAFWGIWTIQYLQAVGHGVSVEPYYT